MLLCPCNKEPHINAVDKAAVSLLSHALICKFCHAEYKKEGKTFPERTEWLDRRSSRIWQGDMSFKGWVHKGSSSWAPKATKQKASTKRKEQPTQQSEEPRRQRGKRKAASHRIGEQPDDLMTCSAAMALCCKWQLPLVYTPFAHSSQILIVL